MLEIKCSGSKKTHSLKYKADWVGGTQKVFRQYLVSLKSYIVYPFTRKDNDATRKFFESIYSATKVDDLIFDGNDHLYLKKVEKIIRIFPQYDYIYDCGCGNGSFFDYLQNERIIFNQYIGIDFAIKSNDAKKKIRFVKSDVEEFAFKDQAENRLIVLCNVSCYLSDEKLSAVLKKVAKEGTAILIIDPVPSLFWDATFDRVKLYYRSPKKMLKLVNKYGFTMEAMSKDYLIQAGLYHLFPLSYAGLFSFSTGGENYMKP